MQCLWRFELQGMLLFEKPNSMKQSYASTPRVRVFRVDNGLSRYEIYYVVYLTYFTVLFLIVSELTHSLALSLSLHGCFSSSFPKPIRSVRYIQNNSVQILT